MLLCCGALWAALAAAPLRAQIRIVPRAKLDSLAHPATAAGGAEAMRFERTLIDAGHIGEDDVPPVYTFRWRNTGGKPLVVTRVQTTCGCAAASWDKKPVAPGGEGAVTVTRPKGHPGFSTGGFSSTPALGQGATAILSLRGAVTASVRTDDDYPHAMGALRLKQRTRPSVRVPARTRCRARSFACEPATLAPGTKGDLVVATRPKPHAAAPADLPVGGPAAERRMLWDRVRGNRNKKQDKKQVI